MGPAVGLSAAYEQAVRLQHRPELPAACRIEAISSRGKEAVGDGNRIARGTRPNDEVRPLVEIVVTAFRSHPHIANIMTHISGARWDRVEEALLCILDPMAGSSDLSPVAENIVDLMCADRGASGRILKPYFRELLERLLPSCAAARLADHITCLFLEMEVGRRNRMSDRLRPAGASIPVPGGA